MASEVVELVEDKSGDRTVILVCVQRDKTVSKDADIYKGAKLEAVKAGVMSAELKLGGAIRCKLSDATWMAQRAKRWTEHPLTLEVIEDDGVVVPKKASAADKAEHKALVKAVVAAGAAKKEEAEAMSLADLRQLVG